MSGHCDFCGIWHSGGCCHPARQTVAALEARVRELEAERDAAKARGDHAMTPECLGTLDATGYVPNCRRFRAERDALAARLVKCENALNGMIGLIQLVASRGDLPTGLDDLMKLSHRMTEARAYFSEREGT